MKLTACSDFSGNFDAKNNTVCKLRQGKHFWEIIAKSDQTSKRQLLDNFLVQRPYKTSEDSGPE